jgi:hypothetical protein
MPQNFLACDREQELLLPPSLREWLPEGHLAWFENGVDIGNGQKADVAGSMKGKLNARRTSGTGTWSLKFVVHDATGAVVDTCDSGVVTWKLKQ